MINKEEREAIKVIKIRTKRLMEELKIEKEDFTDEPKIAYLMQQIEANKIVLNLIDKQENRIKELEEIEKEHQKTVGELIEENKKLKNHYECRIKDISMLTKHIKKIEKENQELKEILTGKSIQEMGTSDLYKED